MVPYDLPFTPFASQSRRAHFTGLVNCHKFTALVLSPAIKPAEYRCAPG